MVGEPPVTTLDNPLSGLTEQRRGRELEKNILKIELKRENKNRKNLEFSAPSDNFDELFRQNSKSWMRDEAEEGPMLMLELPSEESSRRPSKCSMRSGSPGVKNIN